MVCADQCAASPRRGDGIPDRQYLPSGEMCIRDSFHYERITLDAFVQQRKMAHRSVVAQLAERKLPLAVKLGAEVYFCLLYTSRCV